MNNKNFLKASHHDISHQKEGNTAFSFSQGKNVFQMYSIQLELLLPYNNLSCEYCIFSHILGVNCLKSRSLCKCSKSFLSVQSYLRVFLFLPSQIVEGLDSHFGRFLVLLTM